MGFEVIDQVVKIIFKKTNRETKMRGRGIFRGFGGINRVKQEIQQRDDERKLENAEKYTRQCKDEKRYNEF
jgi:hypothetical protein